jgi:hypothetical protein
LCISEDCFMMLEMTLKVVIMQGRSYYKPKLQMSVWVCILFTYYHIMYAYKCWLAFFYQKCNGERFWFI